MKNRGSIKNKIIPGLALLLFLFFGTAMLLSARNNTYSIDEEAHLPAGYSYLKLQDMRLNAEHPPLVKDIAALPLLFMDLASPTEFPSWESGNQWVFGWEFLFQQKKSPDQILFWGRFPMILLSLLLAFLIFKWTKEFFGDLAGLLSLFFFVFSPTVIGSGHIIRMDIASALMIFVTTYYFIRFLKERTIKNLVISGITLGIAQLIKFNLLLLFPYFIFLFFLWTGVKIKNRESFFPQLFSGTLELISIFLICFLIVFIIYQFHIWNYPQERQIQNIREFLPKTALSKLTLNFVQLARGQSSRAITQYLSGLVWQVFHPSFSSRCNYFLGKGSEKDFFFYYPLTYIIKEPIPFHLLTILAFGFSLVSLRRTLFLEKKIKEIKTWLLHNFFIVALAIWVLFYWLILTTVYSINMGVRYLLPIYPFMFFLVAGGISYWFKSSKIRHKSLLLGILIVWQIVSVFRSYPFPLSYYNELVGDRGYFYTVDIDPGQSVKHLAKWVEEKGIEKIKIPQYVTIYYTDRQGKYILRWIDKSYEYYLGEKYEILLPDKPEKGWIAIPATLFMWGHTKPAGEKYGWWSDSFRWLDQYSPIKEIGHSILIYHIE